MAMRRAKPNLMNIRRKVPKVQIDKNKSEEKLNQNVDENEQTVPISTNDEIGKERELSQSASNSPEALTEKESETATTNEQLDHQTHSEKEPTTILDLNTDDEAARLESSEEAAGEHLSAAKVESDVGNSAFKYPPRLNYNRSNSHLSSAQNTEDFSDIEDNVIQMDLQKSANGCPMSPTKLQSRQRIRATPIFGQRRNSFVGTAPSPQSSEESTTATTDFPVPTYRRERHYSGSMSQNNSAAMTLSNHHHTSHKFTPAMGLGRIRTESGCSAFSDSYYGSRKADEPNHHRNVLRRDFEARFTNGVPDKSRLKMFDLIYYNPVTNPMMQKSNVPNVKLEESNSTNSDDIKPNTTKIESNSEESSNAMPVPQLKLNANGELILDDKSLEIETTAEQEARKTLANSSLIYLDENTGMNGFYKRNKRTKEWPPEETIKFYRCLQTVGTDFSLMCHLFPKRTRRDLKLKFKKEERCNGALINKALLYPKMFNIDELKTQLDDEEHEREEAQRKWKEIKAKESKQFKKVHVKTSVGARVLTNGDDIYENEFIVTEKLSKRSHAKHTRPPNGAKKSNGSKTTNPPAMQENITNNMTDDSEETQKLKRRRRHSQSDENVQNDENVENNMTFITNIKTENIKMEQNPTNINYTEEDSAINAHETNQLEGEINEILQIVTRDEGEPYYAAAAADNEDPLALTPNNDAPLALTHNNDDSLALTHNNEKSFCNNAPINNNNYYSNKTFVNLDDGTFTYIVETGAVVPTKKEINEITEDNTTMPLTTEAMSTDVESTAFVEAEAEHDLDERDIEQILTELADGSLVLVSSLDPLNGDKMLNEIYMLDKATGELFEKPLDIPEEIVQEILSVMS